MQSGRNKDSDIDLTFVNTQGLPRARVKFAVVSYRNKLVLEMLKTLGVDTAEAAFDQRLP